MYLKELTINGFKSFAKKGELDFSTSITAIVGPNGSGKSNVAESFRFVLGEQSPSRMRGKKGEDLIWSGSESVARSNRASVSITLNNEKKIFPLDFPEITIERVVYRDGTNEYLINGSRARLKDVQELLASANIGSTGHHIISQGEADRILSANARERREMIEDALGLKIYQYKREESEKKLKKTLENIAQVEVIRREVQPHLKFLERQVKKIEKSLQLQEELTHFYAAYLKREDVYISERVSLLGAQKATPQARLEQLGNELLNAKAQLANTSKDEKSEALITLESDIAALRTKRQESVRESGRIEGQLEYLRRRIEDRKRMHTKVAEAPIPFEVVAEAAKQAESSVGSYIDSNDANVLRKALREVLGMFSALLARSARAAPVEDTREEERELDELMTKKEHLDSALSAFGVKEVELQSTYENLRASIEAEHSASRQAEHEVFKIMNEQRELENEISRIDVQLSVLDRDRLEWKRELQEAVALIGSSASMYATYEITEGGSSISREDILGEERNKQEARRRELEKMKIRLEELGGGASEEVMKEYTDVKERDEFLVREIADLTDSVAKLETLIGDLTKQLNEQFVRGIDKIDSEFNRFFGLMFGGGHAHLLRVVPKVRKQKRGDGEDGELFEEEEMEGEQAEGIEIDVKLPNKRVRGLDMLSGGERALTSIALIFAMSQINPPLFIILDETDAALDEANSKRYGDMIQALGERSQLILITHNRETMSRAGVLYGVTMGGDGISKLLSVKFEEALAVAK